MEYMKNKDNMEIRLKTPARRFGEALPLGNGHMGAMVYSTAGGDKITLTENTFFSGEKEKRANKEGAAAAFLRMREAAGRGRYDQVHEYAERFIGRRENYGTNLPVGEFYIDFCGEAEGELWERGLNIRTGMAWCERLVRGRRVCGEIIASHPDNVLAIRFSFEERMSFRISFVPNNEEGESRSLHNGMGFSCDAFELMHCDRKTGVHLEGMLAVDTDGRAEWENGALFVTDATYADLFTASQTNFGYETVSAEKLFEKAQLRCEKALSDGFETVIAHHLDDMKKLEKTAQLTLENDGDSMVRQIPFMYQYGKYLLFCSSREDSALPAHLQGIWNDNVACRIGWTCDMHLDINTQMNYWQVQQAGLTDCLPPLWSWITKRIIPEGRKTARISYDLPGWAAEIVSNAWGYAAPYWASPIAPCPTGGVWILTHMWEHYLYTQNREFLKTEAFPAIEESVCFFKMYVYEDAYGNYMCGPSISPENSFLYRDKPYQISAGCTYELLMIKELFTIYISACEQLGLYGNPEEEGWENMQEIRRICERIRPYRIAKDGTICEWAHDLPAADLQHRHTSHLLGLYPFNQLTPEKTPNLCEAAKKTLETRLTPKEKFEDTGWARSMLMLYAARLHEGDEAFDHICHMLTHLLEPNKMVYHPPTRGAAAFDHVYELDGNTGLGACIGEMLLQSHGDVIRLLPALPSRWRKGSLTGACVRGGITVDVSWEDGNLTDAVLYTKKQQSIVLQWSDCQKKFMLRAGENKICAADFA